MLVACADQQTLPELGEAGAGRCVGEGLLVSLTLLPSGIRLTSSSTAALSRLLQLELRLFMLMDSLLVDKLLGPTFLPASAELHS